MSSKKVNKNLNFWKYYEKIPWMEKSAKEYQKRIERAYNKHRAKSNKEAK